MGDFYTTLRTTLWLVGPQRRWRWALLVALAVAVAGFEALGAVLILVLLQLVTAPDSSQVPLISELANRLPHISHEALVLTAIAVVALFFIARGALVVGQAYIQLRIIHNAAARLAVRLVRGYLKMPYLFHTKQNSAELIRNAFDSVSVLTNQVMLPIVRVLSQSLLVVGLASVMLWTSPKVGLVAGAVLIPVIWVLIRIVHPRLKELGRRSQEAKKGSLKAIHHALGGVRDIKILGREQYFTRVFAEERRQLARANYIHGAMTQAPRAIIETTLVLVIVTVFALATLANSSPEGLLSTIGVFAYVGLRLQPPLRDIVNGLNELKFGSAVLDDLTADRERVDGVLAEADNHDDTSDPAGNFEARIELQRLRFGYSRESAPALVDVDLAVRKGEFIGICGPTGGGKSTLVDLITGLLTPTEGTILVDGRDLRQVTGWWRRQLGVVSQAVFLVDDTIRMNIALGSDEGEIDEERLLRAVQRAQLEPVIAALPEGLDTLVGERGIRLSGGQRQRVAIARAFYREPAVLILDEGTSALDKATESALVAAIDELKEGRTLIVVAHRISTVRQADRIVVVEAGQISAIGTYDDLLGASHLFRTLAQ